MSLSVRHPLWLKSFYVRFARPTPDVPGNFLDPKRISDGSSRGWGAADCKYHKDARLSGIIVGGFWGQQ